ncbi:hypothetical protein [Rheinheimera faecalis]
MLLTSGFDTYNTPEKFIELLQGLLDKKELPTHNGKIARSLIEKKFRFKHGSLSNRSGLTKYPWCKEVIDKFEHNLIESEGGAICGVNYEFGTPVRFRRLIDELRTKIDELDFVNAGCKSGRISFISFEKKFNFPYRSLVGSNKDWKWAREMLNEFENELYEAGIVGTVWERKVPDIRKYLQSLSDIGALPINELGKLNRTSVMQKFGFAPNQSTHTAERRAPKLKALFAEYDIVIQSSGYSQYSADHHLDKIKLILNSDDVVLDSSLRSISLKWLANQLGISKSAIVSSPNLMRLIEERAKHLHDAQTRGKTKKSFNVYGAALINLGATPYSENHKRVYSFSSLQNLYDLEFAEKVGTTFVSICRRDAIGTVKNKYLRILHFFEWIANSKNIDSSVASSLRENKKIDQAAFSRVCLAYKAFMLLNNPHRKLFTHIITQFGEAKVIPLYTFPTKARVNKDRSHRKSILEAAINKDEMQSVEAILIDSGRYRGIEIGKGKDTKSFLETLLFEKANRTELSDDLSEAMLEITDTRLLEIRIQASIAFQEWLNFNRESQDIVKSATVDCNEFRLMLEARESANESKWARYVSVVFPKNDRQKTLANLLQVIKEIYDGCPPNVVSSNVQMWNKKYQLVGGIDRVTSYLLPTRKALTAALILYLCESGANVSVALTLLKDCIRKSGVPNHKKVVGRKDRSLGKPIFDELSLKSDHKDCISAVRAIEYICLAQPRGNLGSLQYFQGGALQSLSEYTFRSTFKEICSQSLYLKQFTLLPSMLRPTVLLNIQLKDPANLGVAQLIAQHESGATTEGYTNKLPHRVQMEKDMLEFQRSLEIVMLSEEEDAHLKLNIDKAKWEEKKEKLVKTGWGVFCKDRSILDESGKMVECTDVENCVKCKHGRMLVSADPMSISEMIIWKISLDQHEQSYSAKNMNRWVDVWVAWQAFFYVVLEEKMTRGKLSVIKLKALDIATKKMEENGFIMPEPW